MSELPTIMASLEIVDNQMVSNEPKQENSETDKNKISGSVTRTLRKRINTSYQPHQSSKRRCSLIPTKLSVAQSIDDGKGYFLGKKFHPLSMKKLATIYEEPKIQRNGTVIHIGASKLRKINFNSTKEKIKKRKAKVKVLNHRNKRKLTMEAFLTRLSGLMNTSSSGSGSKNITTSLVNLKKKVSEME